MSVFETVKREDVRVMFMRADMDTPDAIKNAWAQFETAVGLKGRKFFGAFYDAVNEYHVCTQLQRDDDPEALGFEVGRSLAACTCVDVSRVIHRRSTTRFSPRWRR